MRNERLFERKESGFVRIEAKMEGKKRGLMVKKMMNK